MPYMHLDLTRHYSLEVKRQLAQQIGALYAEIMQTTPDLVNVTFRELGEGNVWKCGAEAPRPACVVSCEMRRGRPPEQRERFCRALLRTVSVALDLHPSLTAVEMTQHAGDENYLEVYVDGMLQGSLGKDWNPSETSQPMSAAIAAELSKARSD